MRMFFMLLVFFIHFFFTSFFTFKSQFVCTVTIVFCTGNDTRVVILTSEIFNRHFQLRINLCINKSIRKIFSVKYSLGSEKIKIDRCYFNLVKH